MSEAGRHDRGPSPDRPGGPAERPARSDRAVGSVRGRAIADELVAVFARARRRGDDAEFRTWLAERIRVGADVRVSRYRRLPAVINGGLAAPDPVPAARWFLTALAGGHDAHQSGP
jgi:hypothetical protein